MNTTLIHIPRHRSPFKAGNNIGMNTTNRTVNLQDAADAILVREARRVGLSISDGIRVFIATGLSAFNRTAAQAFRTAQGMGRKLASIFSPLPPSELAEVCAADVETLKPEVSAAIPTGGARVVDDCLGEFSDESKFVPAKGGK